MIGGTIGLLALVAAAGAGAEPVARVPLGVFGAWGAFRDATPPAPPRCFAIAAPARPAAGNGWRPFASVAARFGRDRRAALFIRLSTQRSLVAPVMLAIGERRFVLTGSDTAAWSPDAATDRAIVAAMRGARSMSVSAVTPRGRPFADSYALSGAATAIDAATLGCARG